MFGSAESPSVAPSFSMAKKKKTAASARLAEIDEEVPARIKRIRVAMGYETVPPFAQLLGVDRKRWYNFENGFPLPREMAFLLVQRVPGLTLDYVYFGKSDGLPIELARRLGVFDPPGNGKS
jgi:DNA-binding transcriptional regulator YiaG